jgi:4-hydroxy-3-methylbut-2-enyl diphosphate reductase
VENSRVLASPEEAAQAFERCRRLGVVAQSTQNIDNVRQILAALASKCRELKFFNTICAPTTKHQQEIRSLPLENDVMIIIGSLTSANTCRMTEIASALNPKTYQVETAEDLETAWFAGVSSVGVSAGASTPDAIIQQVIRALQRYGA